MRRNRKGLVRALIAGATIVSLMQTASAACGTSMQGIWHFHALQNRPGSDDAAAIRCVATVEANGTFTAPCRTFHAGGGSEPMNVSGTLTKSNACDLTGSIAIDGDADILIRFGHINGNLATGIATQFMVAAQRLIFLFNKEMI